MRFYKGVFVALTLVGLSTIGGGLMAAQKAPDFIGGGPWLNTGGQPLRLGALRGKVVLVEMWTAGCYNCRNTIPYMKTWDEKYRSQGLVIVGVHSPEFENERSAQYVQTAVANFGIRYPVVMDNDFRIWKAYRNAYWPTLYLLDKQGLIRYTHIGEGEYQKTEQTIRQLLAEPS